MENDADRIVAEILRADDLFLAEVGRLTLLCSYVEDCLRSDALRLRQLISDERIKEEEATRVGKLRILEKRDLVRVECSRISRYYGVDDNQVGKILDEFGNINRLRRTVMHGWIRFAGRARGRARFSWTAAVTLAPHGTTTSWI
ncbi:MAG: hypothetical protein ACLPWF_25085 [Bryobacteraceae bacterium]